MLNYIAAYPNPYADQFNHEIILAPQDESIASYVIMEMKELEAIENITIEKVEIIEDQDEMDINQHMVNKRHGVHRDPQGQVHQRWSLW